MVSAVFGAYLHQRGVLESALKEYALAERTIPDNAELVYNIGLLHVDMGDIEQAKIYEVRAKKLGYPLTGLLRKIQRAEKSKKAIQKSP